MTSGSSGGKLGGERDLDGLGGFHEETIRSSYLGTEGSGDMVETLVTILGGDEVIGRARICYAGERRGWREWDY